MNQKKLTDKVNMAERMAETMFEKMAKRDIRGMEIKKYQSFINFMNVF